MQHQEIDSDGDGMPSYGSGNSHSLQAVNISIEEENNLLSLDEHEIEEVNFSSVSTESENNASVGYSFRFDAKHVTEQFKKLNIKLKDETAVKMLLNTGALSEDQVTREEIKEPTSQRNDLNAEGDGYFPDGEETEMKVPVNGFSLLDYQKELAKPALEGKNTIVFAPSGCGKTMVAVEIIIKHLEGNGETQQKSKSKKVCFFAKTIPLANQQFKTIREHLPKNYKVDIFTGETNQIMDMCQFDVVVLTPMILQNRITNENVEGLSVFSLLVFDECHHTCKKEPYNLLMSSYVDKKLDGEINLPQVVGLTASFPVRKSKDEQEAANTILELCANLDAHVVSVVVAFKDELESKTPHPIEKIEELVKRDTDESFQNIIKEMERLEAQADVYAKDINVKEISQIISGMRRLKNRQVQKYNLLSLDLWNSLLDLQRSQESAKSVRLLRIIVLYLIKYHSALEILELVHIQDVMKYLEDRFAEYELDKLKTDGETILYRYFKELKDKNDLCDTNNPNLEHLRKIINEKLLKVGHSSRGIIFVKTRVIAEALVLWLNRCEYEEIRNLKASIFTGTNTKESLGVYFRDFSIATKFSA